MASVLKHFFFVLWLILKIKDFGNLNRHYLIRTLKKF